ncbi:MAG: DUF58 domain-containing protein [Anaerolineales bacterium]|nr:DUF58 domain-containing protein [Anaerolineales bacterium]
MTYALRVVLFLLAVSLLVGAVTGRSLYFRLSYLWGLLLVGSWLMSLISLRGVQVRRSTRTLRSQVGQVFEERYEVINTGRLPRLWIEVRDESPLPGSHGSHVLTLIGGRESRTYLARARLVERGVYSLGPTVLGSGDIFGLFPISRTFPNQNSLLIYPMMVDVRSFPNPPGLLPGGEALRRRTPQITSNAAGVREYAPGDPLNRIHWVSTARRDRLMVKEFELDPLAEVWIFVDAARSVQASKPYQRPEFDPRDVWRKKFTFNLPPSTLEYAVTAAASLARYYLQRGRAVGLVYADQSQRVLPSDRGGRQLGKVLEALALVTPEGSLPLQGLVEAQARHLPRGSTVVMITPSTSDAVYQTADLLTRRGLRPVAVLLDGATFGGYYNSEKIEGYLAALGVPYCRISAGDDLSQVLSAAASSPQWAVGA